MRSRRVVAVGLCIAIVAVAAFLPCGSALEFALVELPWVLLPVQSSVEAQHALVQTDVQSLSLLSLCPPRAPPAA